MKKATCFFMKPLRIALVLLFVAAIGCGGGSNVALNSDDDFTNPSTALTPSEDLGSLSSHEKLIFTDTYAGWLVVHTREDLKLRLDENGEFYSKAGDVDLARQLNGIIAEHEDASVERSVEASEKEVDARRAELEFMSGKQLADWNAIYYVRIEDPNEAVRLLRVLDEVDALMYVYPSQIPQDMDLNSTPDLTTHQGYLSDMNVTVAWNTYGITGQGATLIDGESGWNIDHLDLAISDPSANMDPSSFTSTDPPCFVGDPRPDCLPHIPHGTAVTGIMGALNNGHGVTGIAHDANIKYVMTGGAGAANILKRLLDGNTSNGEFVPGDVIVFPVAHAGILTPGGECGYDVASQYGCLPIDITPEAFDAVATATAAGVVVVEAAGNGSVSLDDPTVYRSNDKDLSNPSNDTDSIIVGASQGANHQKASWSNCGSAVDAYAWGQGVATTGYEYNGLYGWNGTSSPTAPNTDPNAFFIDMFSGTSAAVPMVGAAAALVQSYAKQLMGDTRYLMPWKIREILYDTGLSQSGGGCNIGRQPNLSQALALVGQLWADWSNAYPELNGTGTLNQAQMLDLRDNRPEGGLGILCDSSNPANSDPACPDESMWVAGSGIAEDLDFDGDGRADLVSWRAGQLKIDLSSVGAEADGFGVWDVVVNYTPIQSDVVWPYVEDMNSDGRTDLVLYDKTNGVWYIAYTTSALLGSGDFNDWDHVIATNVQDQLAMDPNDAQYCRPLPGDYNGDGWIDLAVACSDGIFYVALRNGEWPSGVAYFDEFPYLDDPALDPSVPGWAYLVTRGDYNRDYRHDLIIKVPDGVSEAGRVMLKGGPFFSGDPFESKPHIYGGNDRVVSMGHFTSSGGSMSVGVKSKDGEWLVADDAIYDYQDFNYDNTPVDGFGGLNCHPIVADFDADYIDDRVVMCPDGWRIAYSSDNYSNLMDGEFRTVNLIYNESEFTLPGRSYAGGISYSKVQDLLAFIQELDPTTPPPIPVDMISFGTCQLDGAGGCQ